MRNWVVRLRWCHTTPTMLRDMGMKPNRTIWDVLAIALFVVLVVFGLAVAGVFVLIAVGMSHYGANK